MSWVITGQEAGSLGLLDQYGGAAAAYSLRNLSLYHTNPVVRVRRDNDNAEQDFTATEISDGTLAAWVGAGNNGFVRTWYDQSGNGRHAAQNVNASQPKVVDNGVVIFENGKVALDFDGTSHWLVNNFGSTTSIPTTTTAVFNKRVSNSGVIYDGYSVQSILYENIRFANGSLVVGTSIGINEQHLSFALYNGASSSLYIDSQLNAFGNAGSNGVDGITIGNIRNDLLLNYKLNGTVQEIIMYFSNQSTNRTAIEANINAHYSIY